MTAEKNEAAAALIQQMIATGNLVIRPHVFRPTYTLAKQPPVTAEQLAEIAAECQGIDDTEDGLATDLCREQREAMQREADLAERELYG